MEELEETTGDRITNMSGENNLFFVRKGLFEKLFDIRWKTAKNDNWNVGQIDQQFC